MAPTETERFQLREGLRNVLEEAQVTTLMDSLPPMDWHELATKTDLAALERRMDVRLEALRTELGAKIDSGLAEVRAETRLGLAGLNAKIDTGLAGVRGEIAEVRGDIERVRGDIERVRGEFERVRGKIDSGLAKQTYVILAGVAAALAAAMTPVYLALFTGAA